MTLEQRLAELEKKLEVIRDKVFKTEDIFDYRVSQKEKDNPCKHAWARTDTHRMCSKCNLFEKVPEFEAHDLPHIDPFTWEKAYECGRKEERKNLKRLFKKTAWPCQLTELLARALFDEVNNG